MKAFLVLFLAGMFCLPVSGQTHMLVQTAGSDDYLDLSAVTNTLFPGQTLLVLGAGKSYPLYSVRKITFTNYTARESRDPDPVTAFHGLVSNPFNRTAALRFDLGLETRCRVCVYSHDGKRVTVLSDGPLGAGGHTVVWDGKNASGKAVSSGLYIIEATLGKKTHLEKAVLLK